MHVYMWVYNSLAPPPPIGLGVQPGAMHADPTDLILRSVNDFMPSRETSPVPCDTNSLMQCCEYTGTVDQLMFWPDGVIGLTMGHVGIGVETTGTLTMLAGGGMLEMGRWRALLGPVPRGPLCSGSDVEKWVLWSPKMVGRLAVFRAVTKRGVWISPRCWSWLVACCLMIVVSRSSQVTVVSGLATGGSCAGILTGLLALTCESDAFAPSWAERERVVGRLTARVAWLVVGTCDRRVVGGPFVVEGPGGSMLTLLDVKPVYNI